MMQLISPPPIQAPISLLGKTPAILDILLRDLPQELLQWKPADDRWSIAEVLSHLIVIEHLYEQRAHRIVLEEVPTLSKYEALPEAEHVELGIISLSPMLHELANHDLGHVRQIAELYRAYAFYAHGGPFQKYSNLKP
jgi:DinB superfamily